MTLTVEAVYENGVLRPTQPLPLQEHARVHITIRTAANRVRQRPG
jgi:predicted DNA-binding antitoxin AbrB/MazE fold protein